MNQRKLFPILVSLLLAVAGLQAGAAQEPTGYAQLWIEKSARVSPQAVQATVAEVLHQEQDPEEIVVMIHGFKKPRAGSTNDFNVLAERIEAQFEESGVRAALVGVQWDSSVAVAKATGLDALRMIREYHDAIPIARSVGRGPARELLLALQDRFPKAHLTVLAHSMGCEVAAAALLPETKYEEYVPFVPAYEPKRVVGLDMLVLAGSDLDYDFWYRSGISARDMEGRARMTWLTVADYLNKGDKVLNTRKRVRGRASGSSFPRMTLEQLDQAVAERRIFLDREDIPRNHQFLEYYTDARLKRIVDTLKYLTVARAPEPDELAELDEILAAPNQLEVLLPYLDHLSYAAKFYAMWRIERINCGDARHMTDLTLDEVAETYRHSPKKIPDLRAESGCVTVRKAQFPTAKAMIKAGVSE